MRFLRLSLILILALGISVPSFTLQPRIANATSWNNSASPIGQNLYTVWGSSANDIYAGGDGIMVHYDGTSWSVVQNRCYYYRAIAGSSASDVAAVGLGGPLESFNGSSWSNDPSWVSGDLNGLYAIGSGTYIAVGNSWGPIPNQASTPIMRRENGAWSQTPASDSILSQGWTTHTVLNAVWGTSASNIYAGGWDESQNGPVIYHWDGNTWSDSYTATDGSAPIISMWGSSSSNVWAVAGDKNAGGATERRDIYHYNGSSWSKQSFTLNANGAEGQIPTAIWGSSSSDIWIVGENAQGSSFMHYDGTSWTVMPGPAQNSGTTYRSIWGTDSGNVWAVGDGGAIIHLGTSSITPSGSLSGNTGCTGQLNQTISPPTIQASVSTTQIVTPGDLVQISWRSQGATSVTIDGQTMRTDSGTYTYWVTSTHTFTLLACVGTTCSPPLSETVSMLNGLNVQLAVSPVTATLPVSTTTLTATVQETSTTPLTYTFYCNATSTTTTPTQPWDSQVVTSATTQTMSTCAYASAGTYTAKVIVQQAGAVSVETNVVVVRITPNLYVNLTPSSSSGTESTGNPFVPNLTATVSGNQSSDITYTLYCNQSNNATTIVAGYAAQTTQSNTSYSSSACSYSSAGTYYAKVIAQRGGVSAQAQATITVTAVTTPAALGANVTITPTSGTAANLSNVVFKVTGITGTATGPVTLLFWCQSTGGETINSMNYDYGPSNLNASAITSSTPVGLLGTLVSPGCNYSSDTTNQTAKLIIERGTFISTLSYPITINPSDLYVAISPTSATLNTLSEQFTATVSGTITGNIDYYFYCAPTASDTVTDPTLETATLSSHQTSASLSEQFSCTYPTFGSTAVNYYPKVIVTRGTGPTDRAATAHILIPALSVSLNGSQISPTTGSASALAPINATLSSGTISSTPNTGNIDYLFYCNNPNPGVTATSFPPAASTPDYSFFNSSLTTMSVTCPYTSGGTYQPSVWVRRNDLIGHFTTNVTYGNALPASPSLSFLINGNTSPTVALGQSLYFTWPSSSGIDTIVASSPNWTLPSNPTLTCTQSCGNAVADTYGKQTYWLEASGPLGTITQSVVVNVTTAIASSANQAGYNYSKGN